MIARINVLILGKSWSREETKKDKIGEGFCKEEMSGYMDIGRIKKKSIKDLSSGSGVRG